jgi:3-deoxy-D-manno-octulosonic-acid transferase
VADLLKQQGVPHVLRSRLEERAGLLAPGEVLLVDTIGELMSLYALADVVFVGGSLVPTGGHNLLEPASLGKPVIFGPHMDNFREITELVRGCGCGIQVGNEEELTDVIGSLLADPDRGRRMGESGIRLLEENGGSTERHLAVMARLLGTS